MSLSPAGAPARPGVRLIWCHGLGRTLISVSPSRCFRGPGNLQGVQGHRASPGQPNVQVAARHGARLRHTRTRRRPQPIGARRTGGRLRRKQCQSSSGGGGGGNGTSAAWGDSSGVKSGPSSRRPPNIGGAVCDSVLAARPQALAGGLSSLRVAERLSPMPPVPKGLD